MAPFIAIEDQLMYSGGMVTDGRIHYAGYDHVWDDYAAMVRQYAAQTSTTRVLDIGGGANPEMTLDEVESYGLRYVLLDISPKELAKAPDGYEKVVADIGDPGGIVHNGPFDLIFSCTVIEHIADPQRMYRNILDLLRPGGYAIHLFPTLYDPAFIANRLFPEALSEAILLKLQPHRTGSGDSAKFPAYYRWCRGPTKRQLRRMQSVGFEVLSYRAYFGTGYIDRLKVFVPFNRWLQRQLLRLRSPYLTSYALVVLRRPATAVN